MPDGEPDPDPGPDPGSGTGPYFALLNEVAIIEQLGRALLEARLPPPLIAPHFAVLDHLVRVRDRRTPLELAGAFQVTKTTMTHTLAGLVGAGLVEARPNPGDGRSKRMWLTAAGRALRARTVAAVEPDLAGVAAAFPPARVAALLPHLTDLRHVLGAARG